MIYTQCELKLHGGHDLLTTVLNPTEMLHERWRTRREYSLFGEGDGLQQAGQSRSPVIVVWPKNHKNQWGRSRARWWASALTQTEAGATHTQNLHRPRRSSWSITGSVWLLARPSECLTSKTKRFRKQFLITVKETRLLTELRLLKTSCWRVQESRAGLRLRTPSIYIHVHSILAVTLLSDVRSDL